jgi:hypothetical protein
VPVAVPVSLGREQLIQQQVSYPSQYVRVDTSRSVRRLRTLREMSAAWMTPHWCR